MFRWTAFDRVVRPWRSMFCGRVARTSAGAARPPPMSMRAAPHVERVGRRSTRSSLTTSVVAVVISADLIWPGCPVGCRPSSGAGRAGDVRRRHRRAGDRLEELAGRLPPSTGSGVRERRVPGEDLHAGRGDVRLEEAARPGLATRTRPSRRPDRRAFSPAVNDAGDPGVAVHEGEEVGAVGAGGPSAASGCRSRCRPASGCTGPCPRRRPASDVEALLRRGPGRRAGRRRSSPSKTPAGRVDAALGASRCTRAAVRRDVLGRRPAAVRRRP